MITPPTPTALSARTGSLIQRVLMHTPEAAILEGCEAPHHALMLYQDAPDAKAALEELLTLSASEAACRMWVGPSESAQAMTDALGQRLAHAWQQELEEEELDEAMDSCLLGRWDLSFGVSVVMALHPYVADPRTSPLLGADFADMLPVAKPDVMNTPEEVYRQMMALGLDASVAQLILDELLRPDAADALWHRLGVAPSATPPLRPASLIH